MYPVGVIVGFAHSSVQMTHVPYACGRYARSPSTTAFVGVPGVVRAPEEFDLASSLSESESLSLSTWVSRASGTSSSFSLSRLRALLPLAAGGIILGGLTSTRERCSASFNAVKRGEVGEYHHCRNLRERRMEASGLSENGKRDGRARSLVIGLRIDTKARIAGDVDWLFA